MDDTTPEMRERQFARWRQMTPAEKFRQMSQMSATVRRLACIGIRMRYPQAGEREIFLRLAEMTLGPALARKAYPEIDWPA